MTREKKARASLATNTIAQASPLTLASAAGLISGPIVLGGLGLDAFGVWALTGGLAQYGALLDFGVGRSLARFVAHYGALGDKRAVAQCLTVGFTIISGVGLVLAALSAAVAGPLSDNLGSVSASEMRVILTCSVVMAVLAMLSSAVAAFPVGYGRMVLPNVALSVGVLMNLTLSIGSILLGADLVGYALANAAASVLTFLLTLGLVLRSEGHIPLSPPTLARLREVLAFSAKTQVAMLSSLINFQTDKIVIALAVGPGAAGAYELASRVANGVRQLGVLSMSALVPTMAAAAARSGLDGAKTSFPRLTERVAAVGFPLLFLAAAVAPLALGAWLGSIPEYSVATLVVLSLAYVVNVATGTTDVLALVANSPGLTAKFAAAMAATNVLLTVSLAPTFGVWGVLAGTAVAIVGASLAQVVAVHRRFDLALRAYLHSTLPTTVACAALCVPIAVVSFSAVTLERWAQALLLIVLTTAFGIAYTGVALRMGTLPTAISQRILRRAA